MVLEKECSQTAGMKACIPVRGRGICCSVSGMHTLHDKQYMFDFESIEKRNQFVNCHNPFCSKKTEYFQKSRVPIKHPIVTDYLIITVNGLNKGKEFISQKTRIGEESFEIEFNTGYLEIYRFLDFFLMNNDPSLPLMQLEPFIS